MNGKAELELSLEDIKGAISDLLRKKYGASWTFSQKDIAMRVEEVDGKPKLTKAVVVMTTGKDNE